MAYLALGLSLPAMLMPVLVIALAQLSTGLVKLPKKVGVSLCAVGISLALYVGLNQVYSERYPRPSEVFYWHAADTNENFFASRGFGLSNNPWAEQFFVNKPIERRKQNLPFGQRTLTIVEAQALPVSKAKLDLLNKYVLADKILLRVRFQPQVISEMGRLSISSTQNIRSARVDGKAFDLRNSYNASERQLDINYYGLGTEAVILEFELEPGAIISANNLNPQAQVLNIQVSEIQRRWPINMPEMMEVQDVAPVAWGLSESTLITQSLQF